MFSSILCKSFMITKRIHFYQTFLCLVYFIHFAQNLPPSEAIDLTSVIALTSDMNTASLNENNVFDFFFFRVLILNFEVLYFYSAEFACCTRANLT